MAFVCPYKDQNKNCLMAAITGKKKCLNPTPCVYVYEDYEQDRQQEIENHGRY